MTNLDLIEANLIEFKKTRFGCIVNIKNTIYDCYVASSSSIKKYLNLKDGYPIPCLVYKNKGKFTLFSIEYNKKQILVDFKALNKIYSKKIKSNNLSFEKNISGYRYDILDVAKKHIYEIKAVLCKNKISEYPDLNATRIYKQLEILKALQNNYSISLIFILVSSQIKEIYFSRDLIKLFKSIKKLEIKFYYCCVDKYKTIKLKKVKLKNNLEESYVE